MAELPLTRIPASTEIQAGIRQAVRQAETLDGNAQVARKQDVSALTMLLADPQISRQIYTLPSLINHDTIADFIDRHLAERERGEGLLMVNIDADGVASAYHDIQFWPQWAACEFGGAIRRDQQNIGQGSAGIAATISWLFDVIGVELICETAALDNVRTAHLLDRLGFTDKGEIESSLPDGGTRPSRCWELTKSEWLAREGRTHMESKHLYALVLAAGSAQRFGASKQLANHDGEPLVYRAMRLAESVCAERSILVAGSDWQRVLQAASHLQGFFIRNESFDTGMAESIACGVRAVTDIADAVLLLLADQPLISTAYLQQMMIAWNGSDSQIICSEFANTVGPPAIFPACYFDELMSLEGDKGARSLLEAHRQQVMGIPCDAAATDVDTVEDLAALQS